MPFTAKKQRWFNAFDEGDAAVTTDHRERLSEFFLVILLGPAHAGKLLEFCNDNTSAENWTSRSRHRHSRVDDILSVLGFIELLLKQTMFGSRVPTKKNFADTGTRLDLHKTFITQLADLEHKYGWKAQQVPIPNAVRKRLPWDRAVKDSNQDPCDVLIWLVHRFEALHAGLIEKHCQVPAEKILEGLSLAKEEAPFTTLNATYQQSSSRKPGQGSPPIDHPQLTSCNVV